MGLLRESGLFAHMSLENRYVCRRDGPAQRDGPAERAEPPRGSDGSEVWILLRGEESVREGKTNEQRDGLLKTLLTKLVACGAASVIPVNVAVAAALNPLWGVGCRWLQAADGEPDRRSHPRH